MENNYGKRNRVNGHNFERTIRKLWVAAGWIHAVTSRSESKKADDMGMDLIHTAPFGVQCKYAKVRPNYIDVLARMPQGLLNLIFHKSPKGKTYVIMEQDTFWKIVDAYAKNISGEGRQDISVLRSGSVKPKQDKRPAVSKSKDKKE